MKAVYLVILFYLSSAFAMAQITVDPLMPVASNAVTITFNSAQEPRLGYFSSDLYAHTGVLIEGDSKWQYVIGQWNQNNTQPKLAHKGNGIYELVIAPDIKSFYGVKTGDKIQKLAFVFRSSDGSKQTNDLFVTVFEEGLAIELKGSHDASIFDQNVLYRWEANASMDAVLTIRFNDELLASGTGNKLIAEKTFQHQADGWIIATAEKGNEIAKDSLPVFVRAHTPLSALPMNARKGISYPSDKSARLVLWAPNKSFVFVVGDFNNWQLKNEFQMNKDGNYFWIDIDGLESGKEYIFQYYIDGKIKIADPYAEKISDPWEDHNIKSETYPNLIKYPSDMTTEIASVLQPGQVPYPWEVTHFTLPAKEKMVIYEMLIRDFTEEHTFESIIGKLDYLQDLRVNVLELMPVNEFVGNISWGYNPSFFFAPDKYYGPRNGLKKLIDECHKRGIAVVIDMVLNHSYGQSPFVRMYMNNWTITPDNPWYNEKSNFQNTSLIWGYDFNHDREATRELVDSINSFWMSEYKVDGFRFDFTKGFSNTPYGPDDWGSAYDAQRVSNLKRMADEIWKRKPEAIVILEHLADNSEEKELADYGMMLWGNMNHSYREAARGVQSDFSWGLHGRRNWLKPHLVSYMESHDEERVVFSAKTSGLISGSYNIRNLNTALQRQELNSVFLLPLPGPKMIWQFGELGYDYSIDYNGRTGEKPILWSFTQNTSRTNLFRVMAKLNHLKQAYEEFDPEKIEYSLNGLVKWYQLSKGSNHVVAIGNFGLTETTTQINFPVTGNWFDYFGEGTISVQQPTMSITLPPGAYKLFSTRNFSVPNIKVSSSKIEAGPLKRHFFPNPVKDCLFYETNSDGFIEIFSMSGVLVRKTKIERLGNMGQIDLAELPQGVYLAKVKEEGAIQNFFKFLKK